ncbi:PTS sugar transporter subunit IIB [Lihuaxuella thermophila]|uniref:PTS system, cellobiose-specific IIB component n=1 Tax=Lihuaxuella thermophila TaxID=1173111 RepID=A0A1H8CCA4_9BACL|nr:hypothetical protein [Lihuaxuella thermophila]SEM92881.1 PTS system, cellobiose-specific IIB component [Lihuaxuella thermophila]
MSKPIRLLILCSMGMTSGILCKKVTDAAVHRRIQLVAEASGVAHFRFKAKEADAVLLEPQVRHLIKELGPIAIQHHIPLEPIDPVAFATMNGEKVLNQVLSMLRRHAAEQWDS